MGNLEDKVDKLEQCRDRHDERLDKLEKEQLKMSVGSDKDFALIFKKLESIELLLNMLKEKPAKRWDDLISKALSVIVGAVMAYIMLQVGF
jgi:hypothetical protein